MPERIEEIPSLREMREMASAVRILKPIWKVIRLPLRVFGFDTANLDRALARTNPEEMDSLALAPDRFNETFSEHGWIMHGQTDLRVAEEALQLAIGGDPDRADALLVSYFDVDEVRRQLRMMHSIRTFSPRVQLAELALTDYAEQRYHACVPVVLALADGLVNQADGRYGLFAKKADLTAWDSIVGHARGLPDVIRVLSKERKTTRTEQISIPYRQGIMHGMDLGYGNQVVAAKSWALLFYAGELARKLEANERAAPPAKPKEGWRDALLMIRKTNDRKKAVAAWSPRNLVVGRDFPAFGSPSDYSFETPERAIVEFLTCWSAQNYGHMARFASPNHPSHVSPLRMREDFESKTLLSWEITDVQDETYALTRVSVRVTYSENGEEESHQVDFRPTHTDGSGDPVFVGQPSGSWTLIFWEV